MLHTLLKKQDFTKLQLFNYISMHGQVEINQLADTFHLSKTTVRRYIADLNSLLQEDPRTQQSKIHQIDSSNYYLTPLTQENLAYFTFKLQSYFLDFSSKFQLLALFFSSHSLTIHQICDALIISENYCYKLIKQLRSILHSISISIEKSGKQQTFSLKGSESTIRFMYISLFIPAFQSARWPFSHISQNSLRSTHSKITIEPLEHSSFSAKIRVEFLLAIIDKRVRNNQFITPFDEPLRSIVHVFINQHDVTKDISRFPFTFPLSFDSKKEENEREHFNFFIRTIHSSIDTKQDKLSIGRQFSLLDNPITNFYTLYIPTFLVKYKIKEENDIFFEFMYYAVFYHSYSLYSQLNPLSMIQLNHRSSEIQIIKSHTQTLKNDLDQAFSTYFISPKTTSYFTTELVSSLFVTLSQIHKERVLHLYVQYSRDAIGSTFIQSEIHHFFSAKSIKFVSTIHKADIIISDSAEFNTAVEFYFFEDTTRNSSWINLFSFLQKKLYELYFLTAPK